MKTENNKTKATLDELKKHKGQSDIAKLLKQQTLEKLKSEK